MSTVKVLEIPQIFTYTDGLVYLDWMVGLEFPCINNIGIVATHGGIAIVAEALQLNHYFVTLEDVRRVGLASPDVNHSKMNQDLSDSVFHNVHTIALQREICEFKRDSVREVKERGA
jgi:hypothetical protein